ncbi:MAG: aminotransferase class IV [Planctomycetota bacterium]
MTTPLVSIDLRRVSPENAHVPIMDRGFLYGDSVYEVARTFDGSGPFLWQEHLARLRRSADRLRLPVPFRDDQITDHVRELLDTFGNADAYLRLILTRGSDEHFGLTMSETPEPRTVLVVSPLPSFPSHLYTHGVRVAVVRRKRNAVDALDPAIKSGNYLNNILALAEARDTGADDALLLNAAGQLTEATTSNVFIVERSTVSTPDLRCGLLGGITRRFLLDVLADTGRPAEECIISEQRLQQADEVFLTSTLKGIVPVTRLDGKPVGTGQPGRVTTEMAALYDNARRRHLR